jgi:hypothetical protein
MTDHVDVLPRPYVRIELGAGRQNWHAPMPVITALDHVDRLIRHHEARLAEEEIVVRNCRAALAVAIADYHPPDPNRTQSGRYDDAKYEIERKLGEAAAAVTDRRIQIREAKDVRALLEYKAIGEIIITVDDIKWLRINVPLHGEDGYAPEQDGA